MGSSSRWLLNQATHCSVASSTASRVFQGPRRWMISALNNPLMVSASALTLLCQEAAVKCPRSARIKG